MKKKPAKKAPQKPEPSPTATGKAKSGGSLSKQLILLAITSLVLYFYFWQLPKHRIWLDKDYKKKVTLPDGRSGMRQDGRIEKYYILFNGDESKGFKGQKDTWDIETRKMQRWRQDYQMCQFLKKNLGNNGVFLIPPQTYLLEKLYDPQKPDVYMWLYPSLLYYRIPGIHLVDMSNPDSLLEKATHTLYVYNGQLQMLPLTSDTMRQQVINEFKQYPINKIFWRANEVNDWMKKRGKQ